MRKFIADTIGIARLCGRHECIDLGIVAKYAMKRAAMGGVFAAGWERLDHEASAAREASFPRRQYRA